MGLLPFPRSPSVERICAVAVAHFAERGYDGASLNEIAAAAGMRKASLYGHFPGKDALFMTVFGDALALERQCVRAGLAEAGDEAWPGLRYCAGMPERYGASHHLRLLLRTAYLPPAALADAVSDGYETYLDGVREAFLQRLRATAPSVGEAAATRLAQAYLGMVDSLHVELVYTGGRRFGERLDALGWLLTSALAGAGAAHG